MKKNELSERIIKVFRDTDKVLQLFEVAKILKIPSDSPDYSLVKDSINFLLEQNIIERLPRRRFRLKDYSSATNISGTLKFHFDTAYVVPDLNEKEKIYISRKNLNTAFDGDNVLVNLIALKEKKKKFGEVVKILSRGIHRISGKIEFDGYYYFLIPDNLKYYTDFEIPENKLGSAIDGDRVFARFLSWEDSRKNPKAEVFEVIKNKRTYKLDFDTIVNEFMLPTSFPPKVIEEAAKTEKTISPNIIKQRLDLRKSLIITIDPKNAKDFDDAISLEIKDDGNYLLGVHIADVSHYIPDNSNLDKEARKRGNSIYLVDRVVHMLPEELSTEICSLQPNKIRLCMSVFIEYTHDGKLLNYNIHESVIKNKKRYDYDEVQNILETGKGINSVLLLKFDELAQLLRKNRFEKGGIDFESPEIMFVLDENSYPEESTLKSSNRATQLVEEFMLAANKVIASHIKMITKKLKLKGTLPYIYRIHDLPNPDKFKNALNIISAMGVPTKVKMNSSKNVNNYLKMFSGKPERTVVHSMLLRSMSKAEYSSENIGHFGLGFSDYTHFTSPIRRYPDLIIHRLLKKYTSENFNKSEINELSIKLEKIAEHTTNTEKLALEAERASIKLAQAAMARKYIGKEFEGTVSGVMKYGIFVLLDKIYLEGFIHKNDLQDDFYFFDVDTCRLIGKKHNEIFYFGKRVKVKIANADIEKRKINLLLISNSIND